MKANRNSDIKKDQDIVRSTLSLRKLVAEINEEHMAYEECHLEVLYKSGLYQIRQYGSCIKLGKLPSVKSWLEGFRSALVDVSHGNTVYWKEVGYKY